MIAQHILSWFEIPTSDLQRAKAFYSSILGYSFQHLAVGDFIMEMFPMNEGTVSGALVHSPGNYETGDKGPLIYLNAVPDIQTVVEKIEPAGGKVLLPKTEISKDYGYMALFIDTEGNKVGLHSMQ